MDLAKIGEFIKSLRKEKGDTQDELAEKFYVSRRTVSRWETGANLPDIEVLIELADYFNVDLREMLNGEKKGTKDMNEEIKETVIGVDDYAKMRFKRTKNTTLFLLIVGFLSLIGYMTLVFLDLNSSHILDFIQGMLIGIATGAILVAIFYITGLYDKTVSMLCKKNK